MTDDPKRRALHAILADADYVTHANQGADGNLLASLAVGAVAAAGLLAAPADDEAAVNRVAVALRSFFHSDPVTRNLAARAALAALRGAEKAAPLASLPENEWRVFHDAVLSARAPSPPVDREALAKIAHGPLRVIQIRDIPGPWQAEEDALDRLISAGVVAQPPAWWKGQEIEWNATGDTWEPGIIIAPPAPVVALIRMHDNGQRLNVETRFLRARDSSREAGQP